ncbi:dTDP-glucose 4,6-dehydratase [Cohnella faecalis]|uniref:dTDP-glucose 4,6-dehydratase n=1 Tax=Cohnella faecalis TaxID=2315694 RepID=A0A398CKJ6_9BACL|nr:dTDP-glucose 4,6-dehydratase [Cohnella faecalis]RIE03826.1 dTDP-glucose 4,6-dehydratase [Cohnella faecalis]
MNVLVTGGAGFIGSNFVHYMMRRYPDYRIVVLDKLTYAGNLDNLADVASLPGFVFVRGDIGNGGLVEELLSAYRIDAVINFAAESHVDRSIADPSVFVVSNVLGTQTLLEAARKAGVGKFVQISTDEVYGTLGSEGLFTETTPLAPNSPYSASKAGADLLARAYYETYGMNVNITRCSNNYGPFHYPEKLIPLIVTRALQDQAIPVYGDGLNVRDWLHVRDHAAAVDLVLHNGRPGEVYNIGGNNERTNLDIVRFVLGQLGKPETLIRYVEDRLGHDRRYAIDAAKIRAELGWKPEVDVERGLQETIHWFVNHRDWWQGTSSGERSYGT